MPKDRQWVIISDNKVKIQEKDRQVGDDKWKYSKKSGGGGGVMRAGAVIRSNTVQGLFFIQLGELVQGTDAYNKQRMMIFCTIFLTQNMSNELNIETFNEKSVPSTLWYFNFQRTCYMYLMMYRCKKITCPGAQNKLNFRQDKHIFSPNVLQTSKKFSASLFDDTFRTSYLATGQVKIWLCLPGGQVKILRFF